MISKRQYIFLSLFLTRALFFGGAISLLIQTSNNNVIFSSIIGMFLGIILLYLFYRKKDINKYLDGIISILCISILALSSTILTSNYLLYRTPDIVLLILFFIPIIYGSTKGIDNVFRISEVYFPITFIFVLLAFITLPYLAHLSNLLPLFNSSILNFIKGIVIFVSASLLPNLLLLKYKNNHSFKTVISGYVWGAIIVIINIIFILCIYGYEFASILRFPEYLILRKIDLFNYVSNVENIFILEWLCNIIICSLFCAKNLYNLVNKKIFFSIIAVIILVLFLVLSNNFMIILIVKKYFYYVSFIVLLLIILIN